jgi:hypothetical protein
MTRALRKLEKLGKVRRDGNVWQSTEAIEDERLSERARKEARRATAHHEAGHAVVGLAVRLPVAFARVVKEGGDGRRGYVAEVSAPSSVGYVYTKRGGVDTKSKVTALDAFGNRKMRTELCAADCL